jgi:uncharacterized protein DUF3788
MALSAFDDKNTAPDVRSLKATLGSATRLWDRLKDRLQSDHGPLAEAWRFSGRSFGWSFRLEQPKRVLVYMTPCHGYFLASFALGAKAYRAAEEADLSADVKAVLRSAPKYPEGRGIRVPVRTDREVDDVVRLAALKARKT